METTATENFATESPILYGLYSDSIGVINGNNRSITVRNPFSVYTLSANQPTLVSHETMMTRYIEPFMPVLAELVRLARLSFGENVWIPENFASTDPIRVLQAFVDGDTFIQVHFPKTLVRSDSNPDIKAHFYDIYIRYAFSISSRGIAHMFGIHGTQIGFTPEQTKLPFVHPHLSGGLAGSWGSFCLGSSMLSTLNAHVSGLRLRDDSSNDDRELFVDDMEMIFDLTPLLVQTQSDSGGPYRRIQHMLVGGNAIPNPSVQYYVTDMCTILFGSLELRDVNIIINNSTVDVHIDTDQVKKWIQAIVNPKYIPNKFHYDDLYIKFKEVNNGIIVRHVVSKRAPLIHNGQQVEVKYYPSDFESLAEAVEEDNSVPLALLHRIRQELEKQIKVFILKNMNKYEDYYNESIARAYRLSTSEAR